MRRTRRLLLSTSLIMATSAAGLLGCGVSGKVTDLAVTSVPATTTAVPQTLPETTEPDTTPAPGSTTTEPGTVPSDEQELRDTLTRLYRRLGMTDKEVRCAVRLTLKDAKGSTFSDPGRFDISKYLECLGPDGEPGGTD